MAIIKREDRYRNMAGSEVRIIYVDDEKVIFEYTASGRMSTLPRSTVDHAVESCRWSQVPTAMGEGTP